jgi:thiol-disulfide isomerase/thioredoxin
MRRAPLLMLLIAILGRGSPARADLTIGDPAPGLEVSKFVKGDPVSGFEKGQVYVVEFWATWCGPCRATIPHLTELQHKNPKVTFIGVSVFEDNPKEVEPFVKEMGDKMDYRVALDDVPKDGKPDEGKMARTWMEAAGENGIPTAFIIDQKGRVAWIGHPMSLEKPLSQIVAGSYDLAAAQQERKQAKQREQKLTALQEQLRKAGEDTAAQLKILDEAIREDEGLEEMVGPLKFRLLASRRETASDALAYARRLAEGRFKDSPDGLNFLAWELVDPDRSEKPTDEMIRVAVDAARRADKLSDEKNAAIADTLARALFLAGDAQGALKAQQRAVELAKGTPIEDDPGVQARLEEYRKAAGEERPK